MHTRHRHGLRLGLVHHGHIAEASVPLDHLPNVRWPFRAVASAVTIVGPEGPTYLGERLDLGHVLVRHDIEPQPQIAQVLGRREAKTAPRLEVGQTLDQEVAFRFQAVDAVPQVPCLPLDGPHVEPRVAAHLAAALRTGQQELQRLPGLGRRPSAEVGWDAAAQRDQLQTAPRMEVVQQAVLVGSHPGKRHTFQSDDAHTAASLCALAPACTCLVLASLEVTTAARSASPR